MIQKTMRMIGDMLGQLYNDKCLYTCLCEELKVCPNRLKLLHHIVLNYDRMTLKELKEKVFKYGKMIEEEDLFARQIFLCLLRLVKEVEKRL